MNLLLSFILLALLSGCAVFHSRPLLPAETAAAFENRALDDVHLREFLEKNIHKEILPWPPESWDFTMLTLAALYYHPDMDVARAKWGVAEAEVVTAGGRPNPAMKLDGRRHSQTAGGLSPWTLGFALDVPVETAGKRGYRIARAGHLSEAARMNIAGAAWQVRSRLRSSLLDLYSAYESEKISTGRLSVQEGIVHLMEQRLSAGEISSPEAAQSRIALNRTRLSLRETQKKIAEGRVNLAKALGLPAVALNKTGISFECFGRIPGNLYPAEARRQALLGRSDILSALSEYEAFQAALQLEIAKQYPDIRLGPGYLWDQGDNVWSLGISVVLPAFNRNEGPVAEAEARRRERAARFTALQAGMIGEIDRSFAGYNAALRELETADSLVSDQLEKLREIEAQFSTGQADRLALLEAQLELFSAKISRLDVFVMAQKSLGMVEDAVQRPVTSPGQFPVNVRTDLKKAANESE